MPTRRRLAKGIYADRFGISVVYHVDGVRQPEKRFPLDTPLERLERWRKTQIGQAAAAAPRDPRGSLPRDVVTYLKRLKGLPGFKSERSHLRAWLQTLPHGIRRWQITQEKVELAIADWRDLGYAARTIRHRCRVLEALYHRLDGSRAATPLDDVKRPAKPKPRPVSVGDTLIADVALQLRKQEMKGIGRLRDAKTRARFLVRATTGRRPVEVKRAERIDVDLQRRIWFTRTGKGGYHSVIILNDEMVAAWQLFVAAKAWGEYDDRSFAKTLQRNGWPKSLPLRHLRHSTAIAIRERGGDIQDVQDHLGHTSIETTRAFYQRIEPARLAAVSKRLEGRFADRWRPDIFQVLPTSAPTINAAQDAKGRELSRKTRGA